MKRVDKVIKILEDAERDFRLRPDIYKYNQNGLCHYINYHPLLKSLTKKNKRLVYKNHLKRYGL